LGSHKCDFSMVKTWTNCGEIVVICGFFVVVSVRALALLRAYRPAAKFGVMRLEDDCLVLDNALATLTNRST
jgi:hypothetical protein